MSRGLQSNIKYSEQDMLAFAKWLQNSGWTLHSSNDYYYRSVDPHQWPADQTCTEQDLLDAWIITQPIKK